VAGFTRPQSIVGKLSIKTMTELDRKTVAVMETLNTLIGQPKQLIGVKFNNKDELREVAVVVRDYAEIRNVLFDAVVYETDEAIITLTNASKLLFVLKENSVLNL
jgi:hypothetical protein